MRLRAKDYIEAAKALNDAIQPELSEGHVPWVALTQATETLARREGWAGWRTVRGRDTTNDEVVPFELLMPNLAILCTAWVCWLYGAKARDRLSERMRTRMAEFLDKYVQLYLSASTDIFAHWDDQAWAAIRRDVLSEGTRTAHIHYGFWSELPWWQKAKVLLRRPRR